VLVLCQDKREWTDSGMVVDGDAEEGSRRLFIKFDIHVTLHLGQGYST
jgi:hypothetical protein